MPTLTTKTDPQETYCAWSTRHMPVGLLDRLRIVARVRQETIETVVLDVIRRGVDALEAATFPAKRRKP